MGPPAPGEPAGKNSGFTSMAAVSWRGAGSEDSGQFSQRPPDDLLHETVRLLVLVRTNKVTDVKDTSRRQSHWRVDYKATMFTIAFVHAQNLSSNASEVIVGRHRWCSPGCIIARVLEEVARSVVHAWMRSNSSRRERRYFSAPARAAYRTCLSAGCNKQSVSRTTHEVKFPQILSAGPKSNTEYALRMQGQLRRQ